MENLFELFYLCKGVCTDTRAIKKDSLFICLKGENFDGNTFAEEAILQGAKYVIVSDKSKANQITIFWVEDTLVFLQRLALSHREKIGTKIIGITGSNGKTTSKELVNTVLSQKYNVLCTKGNLNNHIGVPLTLLELNEDHELAIIEMGANKPGDIEELVTICKPNFGVITNIGKAHLEGFGNLEGVIKTKTELFEFLSKDNGVIFYNADDERILNQLPTNCPTFSYGKSKLANVSGDLIRLKPEVVFKYTKDELHSDELTTKIIGEYNFYNLLLAAAVGIYFDVEISGINTALSNYKPNNNRSQVENTDRSNVLILDAYNANPTSVSAAVQSFHQTEAKQKLLILGDMLELGKESDAEHERIIKLVNDLTISCYFVGEIYKKLRPNSPNFFKSKAEARIFFSQNTFINHTIMLKGSRGIGLETLKDLF
ncbi:MAG: UDP-N-acetylmuramoyl-tripeptide--D-alanyl-D-alanine ligase [Lishizhenia sp.]